MPGAVLRKSDFLNIAAFYIPYAFKKGVDL
jgi:hypothetical protein